MPTAECIYFVRRQINIKSVPIIRSIRYESVSKNCVPINEKSFINFIFVYILSSN